MRGNMFRNISCRWPIPVCISACLWMAFTSLSCDKLLDDVGVEKGKLPGDLLVDELPGLAGAKMEFVYIPAGMFMMGSPENEEGRLSDEGPQREVTISRGFYLGKYVVTQGQWEAVMGARPWRGKDNVKEHPDHPAVFVSWGNARAFIRKLNAQANRALYRLPTEAEWEYACRAGTTTSWSFGDDESKLGDYAWYEVNAWDAGFEYAQPVGTKKPNPWGLYDMHGNVREWVQDLYGSYASSAKVDPRAVERLVPRRSGRRLQRFRSERAVGDSRQRQAVR